MTTQGFSRTASMMTCSSESTGSLSRASYGVGEYVVIWTILQTGKMVRYIQWPCTGTHLYLWWSVNRDKDSWLRWPLDSFFAQSLFLILAFFLCIVLFFLQRLFIFQSWCGCVCTFVLLCYLTSIFRRRVQIIAFFFFQVFFFLIIFLFPLPFSVSSTDAADLGA